MVNRFILVVIMFLFLDSSVLSANEHKQKSSKNTTSRFILNKGNTFDNLTKLTWRRCSVGTTWHKGSGCVGTPKLMSFKEAKHFAKQTGKGWRLPTIKELYSLIEQKGKNPAINPIIFPNLQDFGEGATYWSTSRVESIPMLIYYIDFLSGRVDAHSEGFSMAVRLVRNSK